MAQEYTVENWQAWESEEGPVRDQHGNHKGTVWFQESEKNIDATFKTQPEKGDKKYGEIQEYTTKAGKTRLKFVRKDRPMEDQPAQATLIGKAVDWDDKNASIRAQWAIGQAVGIYNSMTRDDAAAVDFEDMVEGNAKVLYAMVERVKGLKAEAPSSGPRLDDYKSSAPGEPDHYTDEDGVSISKQEALDNAPNPEDDPNFEMMVAAQMKEDGINIDDIPF